MFDAIDEARFRNEKRRALVLAYAAMRDRILAEHQKVMTAPPVPTGSFTFIDGEKIGADLTHVELARALDREFHRQIEKI